MILWLWELETAYPSYIVSEDVVSDVERLLDSVHIAERTTSVLSQMQELHYSIMQLAGLGKEIWRGVDPRKYVRGLRDEWNTR